MRPVLLVPSFLLIWLSAPAQFYLSGEVLDIHGDKLQNVAISSRVSGFGYVTDLEGQFQIISQVQDDTLTFSLDGYETYTTPVHSTGYLLVTLRMNSFGAEEDERKLVSRFRLVTRDNGMAGMAGGARGGIGMLVSARSVEAGTEGPGWRLGAGAGFRGRVENTFVPQTAVVSFTGEVGRESYSTIRRFLDMGSTVPADAVKIEELLNYFNFSYEAPGAKDIFNCSSQVVACPWDPAHRLLAVRVCARKVNIGSRPPCNLVLLIDASGSMDMPNKLPLIKSGIRLLVDNLRDIDTISVVEFGRQVQVLFAGMPGSERMRILRAVEGLRADGPSPGFAGIKLAYAVAQQQLIRGGSNRVILLTDGDISMDPPVGEQDLEDLIEHEREAGIRLTCGGLGMKSVKDSRLPLLAEIGRGNFAYLDDEKTVEQLLAGELDPRLAGVAENVSVSAEFSPALVSEYRLIGYDNKRQVLQDTAAGLAGARVGSGNSLLALFEIVPKVDTTGADTLAKIRVNYSLPGQAAVRTISFECMNDVVPFDRAETEWKRAICLALFGMKLQRSEYAGGMGWPEIEKMAKKLFSGSNYLDDEYMSLIDRAKRIYDK
ncbi:MAG TPA: von Willebrand factor type A domain-containing protein [Puia sp.]|nr:von Willebrand factor type A domain-containing protein [Puia sp.]